MNTTRSADLALQASELSYRRLFEAAKDGILILNVDTGRISDVNPFLIEMLGFSHAELLGKSVWELGAFKDIVANKAMFEQLQRQGYLRYENLPLETRSGQRIAVEFVSNVYQAGVANVIQCNVRDITQRRLDEDKLRLSERRYRRLFEAARDGILILDPKTRKITDVNPFMIEFLGYSREEFLGRELWQIGMLQDEAASRQAFAELQEKHFIRYRDLPLETKTGQRCEVEFVSNLYAENGHDVIQCNIRDITDRKHAEREIRRLTDNLEQRVAARTMELQAANNELETFSYSVSHDLRAPVRQISAFVELLRAAITASLSKTNLHYLTTIAQSAKRMGDLIDDLLAFSRLGRSKIKKTEVNLDQLVQEALGDFQTQTQARNITWEISPLPTVLADRSLLRLVLVNLFSNAVKFTGTRAQAKIEVGCLPSEATETTIFVRDNGVGFDLQYADKLFAVFQRLHSSAEFEGTGIGLATVQRIIQRHGGRVWAQGTVDAGATFFFSFPTTVKGPDES